MREGASDEEIAELMQELREAMNEYMRQLAQQAQENNEFAEAPPEGSQQITGDQLQQMMDEIQRLMEERRQKLNRAWRRGIRTGQVIVAGEDGVSKEVE